MKNLLILLLVTSCASTWNSSAIPVLDFKSAFFRDPVSGQMTVRNNYLNRDEVYRAYLKEGRIIQGLKSSCFNDPKSYNYINVADTHIEVLRPLVAGEDFEISYSTVTYQGREPGQFDSKNFEVRKDKLRVKRKNCFIDVDDDGENEYVDSELYSFEDT